MKNTAFAVVIAALLPAGTFAQTSDGSPPGDLEQRVRILERRLEVAEEEKQAKAKEATTAQAGDKGFGFKNADGSFELKLKGLLQFDGRFFGGDEQTLNDTFLARRVEPTFELTLGKLAFVKIQPQFAGDAAGVSDVFGELRFHPAAGLRFGKFKTPLGLEYLQGSGPLMFVERGYPTEVGAGRDLGLQLQGELFGGTTSYAVAWLNGAPDGRDAAAQDTDNRNEVAARLFFEPFKADPGLFQGLGFGLGATQGNKQSPAIPAVAPAPGSSAFNAASANFNNTLPRYRSPGQLTVFSYLISTSAPTVANTVVAAGEHTRLSPQLYYYVGGFGLIGEQISSEQEVSINNAAGTFEHKAWQVQASYLLTGENASYKGSKPDAPYTVGGPGWGALEIALRHGVLDIDDDVFPTYADPTKSVSEATTNAVALNWYLTGNARITLDYEKTAFDGGAAGGADRLDEDVLLTRLQLAF